MVSVGVLDGWREDGPAASTQPHLTHPLLPNPQISAAPMIDDMPAAYPEQPQELQQEHHHSYVEHAALPEPEPEQQPHHDQDHEQHHQENHHHMMEVAMPTTNNQDPHEPMAVDQPPQHQEEGEGGDLPPPHLEEQLQQDPPPSLAAPHDEDHQQQQQEATPAGPSGMPIPPLLAQAPINPLQLALESADLPALDGIYHYPKSQEGVHHEPWIRLFGAVLQPSANGFVVTDYACTRGVSLWTFVLRLLGVKSLGWRTLDESATWKSIGIRVTKLRKQQEEGTNKVNIAQWIGDHIQWRREFRTRPFDMNVPRPSTPLEAATQAPTKVRSTFALGITLRDPADPETQKALANAVDLIAPGAVPSRMGLVFAEYQRLWDAYEPLSLQQKAQNKGANSAAAKAAAAASAAAAAAAAASAAAAAAAEQQQQQQQHHHQYHQEPMVMVAGEEAAMMGGGGGGGGGENGGTNMLIQAAPHVEQVLQHHYEQQAQGQQQSIPQQQQQQHGDMQPVVYHHMEHHEAQQYQQPPPPPPPPQDVAMHVGTMHLEHEQPTQPIYLHQEKTGAGDHYQNQQQQEHQQAEYFYQHPQEGVVAEQEGPQ